VDKSSAGEDEKLSENDLQENNHVKDQNGQGRLGHRSERNTIAIGRDTRMSGMQFSDRRDDEFATE
jgi:hypothetical protein